MFVEVLADRHASQFTSLSPSHVSVPIPPSRVSVPSSPVRVSSPSLPDRVSLPAKPCRTLGNASPVRLSVNRLPFRFSIPVMVSVPSPVAVPVVKLAVTALWENAYERVSVPVLPSKLSFPGVENNTFGPASPVRVSSCREPSRSSMLASVSVPSPAAVPAAGGIVSLTTGTATGEGTDTLANIEDLEGSRHDDTLTGDAGPNVLFSTPGNDSFDGSTGTDTLSYAFSQSAVTASLTTGTATGEGTDTITGIENLNGSPFTDNLTGDALPNVLHGLGGNDTLSGSDGDDTLTGD